jgi:hypothetical protein
MRCCSNSANCNAAQFFYICPCFVLEPEAEASSWSVYRFPRMRLSRRSSSRVGAASGHGAETGGCKIDRLREINCNRDLERLKAGCTRAIGFAECASAKYCACAGGGARWSWSWRDRLPPNAATTSTIVTLQPVDIAQCRPAASLLISIQASSASRCNCVGEGGQCSRDRLRRRLCVRP